MKKIVIASALLLVTGVATAAGLPSLGVTDQVVQSNKVDIGEVTLAHSGYVEIQAAGQYGNVMTGPALGRTYLSAGPHHDVEIRLNPDLMNSYGYNDGTEKTAFAKVSCSVNRADSAIKPADANGVHARRVVKSVNLLVPNPVDG